MNDYAELSKEQERAVFEAVFAEIYDIRTRSLGHFDRDKFGNYVNDRVGTSWRMWKARALLAERDALREALQSIVDCCDEDHAARDYSSRQTEIRGIARAALAQGES